MGNFQVKANQDEGSLFSVSKGQRMKLRDYITLRVLHWCARRLGGYGTCANRTWFRGRIGDEDVLISYRDLTKPDGYSKEELMAFQMIFQEKK